MTAGFRLGVVAAALVAVMLGLPWNGAVPMASAQVSVVGASPSSAAQGTSNLNVTISGKNFKAGAMVTFYRTDTTDTGGVVVKSTTYKRSSQLVATIDVTDIAERGSYDIKVTVGGNSATGRALFGVTPKPIDPCTSEAPTATTPDTSGAPGSRDATFGHGSGVVIGPKFMEVRGVAIDGEGRIVSVGSSYDTCANTGDRTWMIVRYLATGEFDSAFGEGGVVTKRFQRSEARLNGVAIDSQGRLVVVGSLHGKLTGAVGLVARYNATGTLDTAFAATGIEPGIRSLSLERYMTDAKAVAIQSDGKIVVAGTDGGSMAVFRLNDDGTLDTAKFNNGAVRPQLPGRYVYTFTPSYGLGITIQTVVDEERIVVAGPAGVMRDGVAHRDGAVWRLTSGGVPDSSFGTSGMVTRDFFGKDDEFRGVVVDSLNRIVVAGQAYESSDYSGPVSAVLARYLPHGDPDTSFGFDGRVVARNGWAHNSSALAMDSYGRIYVGESATKKDAGGAVVANGAGLWRFTADGSLDPTFDAGGWVFDTVAEDGRYAMWSAVAVQPDGKIIAAGTFLWGASYPALARFWQ